MWINCERGNCVDSIGELTWEVKRHSNVTRLVGKLSVSLIKVHEMEEIASQGLVRWRGFQSIMFILQTKYCSMHIMGRDSTWWISPMGCNRIQLANCLSVKNQLKFLFVLGWQLKKQHLSNSCPLEWGRTFRRRCNYRSCLFITKQNFSCTYPLFGRSSPRALGVCVHQCCAVVWFFKEPPVDVFNHSRIKEPTVPVLWKQFNSNNHHFWLFQIPQRTNGKFLVNISKSSKNQWFSWKNWQRTSSFVVSCLAF